MWRRRAALLVMLVLAGLALAPLEKLAAEVLPGHPRADARAMVAAAEQGLSLGALGGFRAIVADLLWLEANRAWERCDLARTQRALALVVRIDARPTVFWLHGARMIGYDFPYWRIAALGGEAAVSPQVARHIQCEQARAALTFLARARLAHPDDPLVLVEIAQLEHTRLGEAEAAAEHYRRAALCPRAPFYAARLHAVLLVEQGRHREAYDWLVRLHPTLPPEAADPTAMADTVLGRIRELEEKLALGPASRYQPERE